MSDNNTDNGGKTEDRAPPPEAGKKPEKTKEQVNRENMKMIAASQFAYTLTIGTCFFGWLGHWVGMKLGGAPWNVILMLLLASLAFVGEVYRMWLMFNPKNDDSDKKDGSKKNKNGSSKDDKSK